VCPESFRNTPKPVIPLIGLLQTAWSKKAELFALPGFLPKNQYTESVNQHRVSTGSLDEKYRVYPIYIPCVLLDVVDENPLFQGSFSKRKFMVTLLLKGGRHYG
jgi:hypothetical protein